MTQKSSKKQFQQRVPTEELQQKNCKKEQQKKLKQHNSSIGPVVSDLWFRTCGVEGAVSIAEHQAYPKRVRDWLIGPRKRERGNGSEETGARKVTMDATITD